VGPTSPFSLPRHDGCANFAVMDDQSEKQGDKHDPILATRTFLQMIDRIHDEQWSHAHKVRNALVAVVDRGAKIAANHGAHLSQDIRILREKIEENFNQELDWRRTVIDYIRFAKIELSKARDKYLGG